MECDSYCRIVRVRLVSTTQPRYTFGAARSPIGTIQAVSTFSGASCVRRGSCLREKHQQGPTMFVHTYVPPFTPPERARLANIYLLYSRPPPLQKKKNLDFNPKPNPGRFHGGYHFGRGEGDGHIPTATKSDGTTIAVLAPYDGHARQRIAGFTRCHSNAGIPPITTCCFPPRSLSLLFGRPNATGLLHLCSAPPTGKHNVT